MDGIFITDRWNIIYYTGLFHSTTQRPFACFIPTKTLEVHWFHPGIDRDLVDTWWSTSAQYYFDFKHSKGGFPNRGEVAAGDTVDLTQWRLEGIAGLGYGDKKIALDHQPTVNRMKRMTEVIPKASFESVDDICIKMRMVKTAEEIALIQRSMNYWSRIHAFARDYILEHAISPSSVARRRLLSVRDFLEVGSPFISGRLSHRYDSNLLVCLCVGNDHDDVSSTRSPSRTWYWT